MKRNKTWKGRPSARLRPTKNVRVSAQPQSVILLPWPSDADILREKRKCVSVVIPVLNESKTIASVVRMVKKNALVDEVIVVDDGSIDGTPELAETAGATVITSTMLGKGGSMEDGMRAARNEIILYLDGDLKGLRKDAVDLMVQPLLLGKADFVKAKFTRKAGRVTVLTARPLIRTYFPELSEFDQPLSGIMAAKRSLLQTLRFENDYGVDVGLFIDAAAAKARLEQVDIGHIKHDSQTLERLGEMATQVARTILGRAASFGRLRPTYVQEVVELERHRKYALPHLLERVPSTERLALFDMDGVLLDGRFIVALAEHTGRMDKLSKYLDNHTLTPENRARRIAAIFTGVPKETFEKVARQIPLIPGAVETIVSLRKMGYRVGIVTDSYQVVAETVRRRVFADFCFGNMMRFKGGKASGRVTLSPAMFHPEGCQIHKHCKENAVRHLLAKLAINPENILAVGDGENDVCMLKLAGTSVAFQPKSPRTAAAAQHIVHGFLTGVLKHVPSMQPSGLEPLRSA